MDDNVAGAFFSDEADPYVLILGVNESAPAIAVRSSWGGFHVA
jgi:hypothetical protein